MTILTAAQDVAILCNQPRPTAVFASPEAFETEMQTILFKAGEEVMKRHDWGALVNTTTLVTNDALISWTLPSDFDRLAASNAVTYGSLSVIRGGLSDSEWRLQARMSSATPRYRLRGNVIDILPIMSAANSPVTVQYVSKNFIQPSSGSATARPTADTDTFLVPERAVVAGAVAMWKALKLQPTAQIARSEYEAVLAEEIAMNRGMRIPTTRPSSATAERSGA